MPAAEPALFPYSLGSNQTGRPGPARTSLPRTSNPDTRRHQAGSRKGCRHLWFLGSYLSCALRNLKSGAFEEPHHLDLQRLLGRRLRAARDRPQPAPLRARHGGTRELLGAQTLRVARATARPRPRRFQEGAEPGAGRAAAAGSGRTLSPVDGEPSEGARAAAVRDELPGGGTGNIAPRVPQPGSPPVRAPSRAALASRQLPDFAADRLSGLVGSQFGASGPVTQVTRDPALGLSGAGWRPRSSGERRGGPDHLCAPPWEGRRLPTLVRVTVVAGEAE